MQPLAGQRASASLGGIVRVREDQVRQNVDLDAFRELIGAREVIVFTRQAGRRCRILAASPAERTAIRDVILQVNGRYQFVERAGCVLAIDADGTLPLSTTPSNFGGGPHAPRAEHLIAKVLGQLILRSEASVIHQVSDSQSGCLALASPRSLRLLEQVESFAGSARPVLILGETGVGKELMARFIHRASGRQKFVGISMAQMRGETAISELFGHVKGAFTGAITRRLGAFLEAGDGTLFLDEISEMPEAAAVLLLRAIEERRIKPLGSDREVTAPARILAATSRPENLRTELFYRFVHRLIIPPLRERREDVRSVARFIAFREGFDISEKALGALGSLSRWRGNVRELEYFLFQALGQTGKNVLGIEDITSVLASFSTSTDGEQQVSPIREVRESLGLSIRESARILGIPKSTFEDIEKGRSTKREPEVLGEIARFLETSAEAGRHHPDNRRRTRVRDELKRFLQEE